MISLLGWTVATEPSCYDSNRGHVLLHAT